MANPLVSQVSQKSLCVSSMLLPKVVLGGFINGVATFTFIATGAIVWKQGAVMTLGAIGGGFFAAHYAQRLPQRWIGAFVILVGSAMTVYFFVRAYL